MEAVKSVGIAAVLAALLAWLPGQATAQEGTFAVDGHAGIAFPTSNIQNFQSIGPAFGLDFGYWISDRIQVRGSGALEMFSGKDAEDLKNTLGDVGAPDLTMFHVFGGFAFRLSPPEDTRWDVTASVGGGVSSVSSDDFPAGSTPPTGESDFSESYFSLHTGLKVGYDVNDQYTIFVRGDGHFAFADPEDTAVFTQFDQEIERGGFEDVWDVPVTAGVQIRF